MHVRLMAVVHSHWTAKHHSNGFREVGWIGKDFAEIWTDGSHAHSSLRREFMDQIRALMINVLNHQQGVIHNRR